MQLRTQDRDSWETISSNGTEAWLVRLKRRMLGRTEGWKRWRDGNFARVRM